MLCFAGAASAAPRETSAATAAAKPTQPNKKPLPSKQLLRADDSKVTEMSNGLLKSAAGKLLNELLLPSKELDPET